MTYLMISVGMIQIGKPPMKSDRADPIEAARAACRRVLNRTDAKIIASPK